MKIGTVIRRVRTCSSTNDVAREMAVKGEEEGAVVVAEEQTEGRGTKGRSWHSAAGKGLYVSVILRPPKPDIFLLPLLAGVAVKEAVLSAAGISLGVRWPNDIVWKGKKIGGILCESSILGNRVHYVILGIGLNLSHGSDDFPEEIRRTAASLDLISGCAVDKEKLCGALWKSLERWYRLFLAGHEDELVRAVRDNLVFSRGQRIILSTPEGWVSGHFAGLDPRGGLILEVDGRQRCFYSAEVLAVDSG